MTRQSPSAPVATIEASPARPVTYGSRVMRMAPWIVLGLLAVVPPVAYLSGHQFWLDVFTRLAILAIAATGLNLVLGFGGLVSFGHAAFVGLGAYAVGIPVHHALNGGGEIIASSNGFLHVALAVAVSALFALVTGAISLRTRGMHFIMITMAFGQMVFFAIVSIAAYGGDDGLTIYERSRFGLFGIDHPLNLYALAYISLLVVLGLTHRIVNSRFGLVLRGARANEERIRALGYNAYAYRLVAYVISGAICGYAGALLANFTTFISPEMMDWTRSGELLFIVILGGIGTLFGPVLGASVFLLLEEFLSRITIYWHLPFGIILVLCVLFLRGGISGLFGRSGDNRNE